jgi:hypothetical protein
MDSHCSLGKALDFFQTMDASVSSFTDCISDFFHHFIALVNSKKELSLIMKKAR